MNDLTTTSAERREETETKNAAGVFTPRIDLLETEDAFLLRAACRA